MKIKVVIITGVIVILCIVGILLQNNQGSLKTLQLGKSRSVKVSAKKHWVSSGLNIESGARILIEAEGKWSHGNEGDPENFVFYSPNGYDKKDGSVILPTANVGALVGRIGSGEIFFVGESLTLTSSVSGELSLAINDASGPAAHENNDGELKVTIERM